jgi:hypothetical protein
MILIFLGAFLKTSAKEPTLSLYIIKRVDISITATQKSIEAKGCSFVIIESILVKVWMHQSKYLF